MSKVSINEFVNQYGEALEQGSAALFAGAGLSQASGFVNWKELLRDIATNIGLDIDREYDLVAVAQYEVNQRGGVRSQLNQLLIEELTKDAQLSPNHRLIASMPIHTVWTTNYDSLIEQAFKEAYKRVDVKIAKENLAITIPKRDVTIYKMHGDVSQAHEAVLTKEDYETYNDKRQLFTTMLQGDLISKTFLFLGFSFTDPNIDYILSRIRALLGTNQRQHYCIMKWPQKPDGAGQALANYEYERTKLELRIRDLDRYSIQTVMIDNYGQITDILQELSSRCHRRYIFVSGSAHDYEPMGRERVERLARTLGREIIRRGYNLISGFGLGIGGAVIIGATETLYEMERESSNTSERINLRPFPPEPPEKFTREQFHTKLRRDMLSNAGCSVFLCGNRLNTDTNEVDLAKGVMQEFQLTTELKKHPIPVGASGHAAQLIWQEVNGSLNKYYPGGGVEGYFKTLGDINSTNEEIIDAIFGIMKKVMGK